MSMPQTTTPSPTDAPSHPRPGHPAWCTDDDIENPGSAHPRRSDPSVIALLEHGGLLPAAGASARPRRVQLTREDVLELGKGSDGLVIATEGEPLIFVGDVSETGCLDARAARELAADLLQAADILEGPATA